MGFFSLSKKNFSLNNRKKYVTLTIENKENIKQDENKHIDNNPTGLWTKCPSCQEILYKEDIESNLKKCPKSCWIIIYMFILILFYIFFILYC